MKLAIVISPRRFRDEELEVPAKAFSEAGIEYDIVSTETGTCTGVLGADAEATLTVEEVKAGDYDGIVIVGGLGSEDFLWDSAPLHTLVQEMHSRGSLISAICLSPVVLAHAGVLEGRTATVFKSPLAVSEMKRGGANLVDIHVVADMNIITADGPMAAGEFAEQIIEKLGC